MTEIMYSFNMKTLKKMFVPFIHKNIDGDCMAVRISFYLEGEERGKLEVGGKRWGEEVGGRGGGEEVGGGGGRGGGGGGGRGGGRGGRWGGDRRGEEEGEGKRRGAGQRRGRERGRGQERGGGREKRSRGKNAYSLRTFILLFLLKAFLSVRVTIHN